MKKIVTALLITSFAMTTVQAQKTTEQKTEQRGKHLRKSHGQDTFKNLNLTEEQKAKFKTENESFRKQMLALRKEENITVKDQREKMAQLRKDHRAKTQSFLTETQKSQLKKAGEERKTKMDEQRKQRPAKMKQQLGLTDEQSAKLEASKKVTRENMKSIKENASLSDSQKKEQTRELLKRQQEDFKSILTEEQVHKMKDQRKRNFKRKAK